VPDNVVDYTVRESHTFNIFLGLRLTDADPDQAKQALSQLQMYPYSQRANPPKAEILDVGTKTWSGLPPRGMEYWERLNDVIQREPIEPHDIFFHAMLRPLGLEKGKPFKPDARQTKILTDAALVGERALILNEQKIADRSSRMDLRKNADGSVDIYCGPNAPAGFETNWIPTVSGKNWFAYFRFYQPTEAYFDRSWPLADFEQV
jgi:hypothetical protein